MPRNYQRKKSKVLTPKIESAIKKAFKLRDTLVAKKGADKKHSWPRGVFRQAALLSPVNERVLASHCQPHKSVQAALQAVKTRKRQGDHKRVMPKEMEDDLYRVVMTAYQASVPVDKLYVQAAATYMMHQKGLHFNNKDDVASWDWVDRFEQERELRLRCCTEKEVVRTLAESEEVVRNFLQGYDEKIPNHSSSDELTVKWPGWQEAMQTVCDKTTGKRYIDHPERVANADETDLSGNKVRSRGYAPKGAAAPSRNKWSETNITAFCWTAANGYVFPDVYIREGKYWTKNWLVHARAGSVGIFREDGYFMTQEVFLSLLAQMAKMIPGGVTPEFRFMLLLDGHVSRVHPDVVKEAKRIGFDLFLLPSHMTHVLQPMDYFYGTVKRAYYKKLKQARALKPNEAVPVEAKIKLWSEAMNERLDAEYVQQGYDKLGIFPPSVPKALARLRNLKGDAGVEYKAPDDVVRSTPARQLVEQLKHRKKRKRSSSKPEVVKQLVSEFESVRETDAVDDDNGEDGQSPKKKPRVAGFGRWLTSEAYEKATEEIEAARQAEKDLKQAQKEEKKKLREEKEAARKAEVAARKAERARKAAEKKANEEAARAAKARAKNTVARRAQASKKR